MERLLDRLLERLNKQTDDDQPAQWHLARALYRARTGLFWEQLWPALILVLTTLGLFVAFSWFGLWLMLPPLARAMGLIIFVVLGILAAIPLFRLRRPSIANALRRLDRDSGEVHRPATTIADRLSAN